MNLDPLLIEDLAERFLREDLGRGDITTDATISPGTTGSARIEAREPMVVAGLALAEACFRRLDPALRWTPSVEDGDRVETPSVVARLDGDLRAILSAERTALNLLQRTCGVATMTARFVGRIASTGARILDTRKTTPGLRAVEKYAVRMGGGNNHRFGLDDGILIKDNHIAALNGDIAEAVRRARAEASPGMKVEVEVDGLDQIGDALAAGADALLLDNFTPDQVAAAVKVAGGKATLEASGGIDLDNVLAFAQAGADFISIGALTHSAPASDLALEVGP